MKHQFQHAHGISDQLTASDLTITRNTDLVWHSITGELLFITSYIEISGIV
jgi:hypothetical protein